MDLNEVQLMGRLGKDPIFEEVGKKDKTYSKCTLVVATQKKDYKKENNKTEWHNIVVWGKRAEHCRDYLKKGSLVFLKGELETLTWKDKEGKPCYRTQILANRVDFLSTPNKDNQQQNEPLQNDTSFNYGANTNEDIPY